MRRLLFILFLCTHWLAQGQTPYEYRYWFDGDETTIHSGTETGNAWQMDVDVSELTEAFHLMYFQVKDTAGVWSSPRTHCFVNSPVQGNIMLTYWFDGKEDEKQTIASRNGLANIDVTSLSDGFHLLHVMTNITGSSHNSIVKTAFFLKQAVAKQCTYRLWVDDSHNVISEGTYTGRPIEMDLAGISEGFHLLRAQVSDGSDSSPLTSMFLKVPQVIGVEYLTAIFLVDGKEYKQEKVPTQGGMIEWTFDASGIPHGLHKAQAMVLTPTGAATGVKDAFFYRAMTTAEKASMRCFYSIDGSPHKYEAGRMENNLYHFDLDVAEATDGFHRISYMLMGENGTSSKVMSAFFIKTPIGGEGVTQYDYWLNENEENTKNVKLDKHQTTFQLISLLPVESCPIRSSSFHFEVDGTTPAIYAKNDFHIRFYDTAGRITEASKSYIDYNVSQPLTDVEAITDKEGIYNCDKPAENDIIWFKIDAKTGDSLAIKTSQASTLQIFSPSGKEVYNASGSESVNFSGCHAYEDGTHYIALHDVKGTAGTTINLHHQHIDKYAVLRYDVHTVGNGGLTTITFDGNGYYSLDSVGLSNENISVPCVNLKRLSDAKLEATFEFGGITEGMYDFHFHFLDETKHIKNGIKAEEAKEIVLDNQMAFDNLFLLGNEAQFRVKASNKGNNTAYRVPIYVYVETKLSDGNPRITLNGFNTPSAIDGIDMTDFSESERNQLADLEEQIGDNLNFLRIKGISDNGDSILISVNYFFIDIPPFTKKEMSISISTQEPVQCYTVVPDEWPTFSDNDYLLTRANSRQALSKAKASNAFCCYHDRVECVLNYVATFADFASQFDAGAAVELTGCVTSALSTLSSSAAGIFCSEDAGDGQKDMYEKLMEISGGVSYVAFLKDCLLGMADKWNVFNWIQSLNSLSLGAYDTHVSCKSAFFSKKPGCPPTPPRGGTSTPVNSFDPNDIYGYQAESGSKAIRKNLEDVYYTIEFENDPEFATASAHEVVICDTLNGKLFDLSTFQPTSLKIGERVVELDGDASTITTVDMRPEINAIAQMELNYDDAKGIATWRFTSLDPMTMERTDNPMSGFLPVNNDAGNGIGEVRFNISLRKDLDDGTEIPNRASIIFDQNEAIITPTWINIVDSIAPVSKISRSEILNDSTVTLHFEGTDNRSGVWKYELYVQQGTDAPWWKVEEDITDSTYEYKGYTGIDYGFCVLATDSAGNVEHKELVREVTQATYLNGDANGDGVVNTTDAMLAIDKYLGNLVYLNFAATDVNGDGIINTNDAMLIQEIYLTTETASARQNVRRRLKSTKQ